MKKNILGWLAVGIVVVAAAGALIQITRDTLDSRAKHETKVVTKSTKKSVKKAKTKKVLPKGKTSDWNLLLVNDSHPLNKKFQLELATLPNGQQIDKRILPAYQELTTAAKKAKLTFTVISGYRSPEYQKKLLEQDINSYMAQGLSREEAKKKALEYMTKAGTSEHHTGLSIDVLDEDWYQSGKMLETAYGEAKGGKWLAQNAYRYGFIIRYPKGKEEITHIQYEPWHLRYVGKAHAAYIQKHHLTLEEYVHLLKNEGE